MRKEIEIQTKAGLKIIQQDSLFVIAEVGNQFNGDLETAKKLALAAKEAGADAVKYIFWFPDEIMADKSGFYEYNAMGITVRIPMYDMLSELRLPFQDWVEVKFHCDKIGIIMMSTANCFGAYEWVDDLGLLIMKLSSWEYNFLDLWRMSARLMLPCIADLGPVTEEELDRNVEIFLEEKNKELILMHCTHSKDYRGMNMNTIPYMRDRYDCLVGYSAAGRDNAPDFMAIGMGACVIEKRLTLNQMGGVLHDAVSLEPDEFKDYITLLRNLKESLGTDSINQSENDWEQRPKWFRRVVTNESIGEGDIITRPMLECKRGEDGFPPERIYEIVGKTAKHDMPINYDIKLEDVG